MIVKKIKISPDSRGPVQYQLIWQCEKCCLENILSTYATLLLDQPVFCNYCNTQTTYKFDPRLICLIPDENKMLKLNNAIKNRFQNVCLNDPDFRILGQDFIFSIASYFANLLVDHD